MSNVKITIEGTKGSGTRVIAGHIVAALRELGVDVRFSGVEDEDADKLLSWFGENISHRQQAASLIGARVREVHTRQPVKLNEPEEPWYLVYSETRDNWTPYTTEEMWDLMLSLRAGYVDVDIMRGEFDALLPGERMHVKNLGWVMRGKDGPEEREALYLNCGHLENGTWIYYPMEANHVPPRDGRVVVAQQWNPEKRACDYQVRGRFRLLARDPEVDGEDAVVFTLEDPEDLLAKRRAGEDLKVTSFSVVSKCPNCGAGFDEEGRLPDGARCPHPTKLEKT